MKRMYAVLSVMILFSLWMFQALGQKIMGTPQKNSSQDREEAILKRMKLREEMHRRMMDKIINGIGPDDDLFQGMDQMMNEAFSDSFADMNFLGTPSPKYDWTETKDGRTLVITPDDPSQKIDLDVKDNMVTMKGETKVQTENGSSMSSFQNSFPIPGDCDGSKVKISNKDGKLILDFPFRTSQIPSVKKPLPHPIQKDTRVPLPPSGDEITI